MSTSNKPTKLFWAIAIVLLIWNLMGVTSFIFDTFFTEMIASSYTEAQMEIITTTPIWSKALYGIATIGGLLAAFFLITRKLIAVRIYLISLLAVFIHTAYQITVVDTMETFGIGQGLIFPLIIAIIAVFEYWWSKYSASKKWLT